MELLIFFGYMVMPAAAVLASFAFGGDADSPGGDGMILGCFLLAVPLWPITMSFWLFYVPKRHSEVQSLTRSFDSVSWQPRPAASPPQPAVTISAADRALQRVADAAAFYEQEVGHEYDPTRYEEVFRGDRLTDRLATFDGAKMQDHLPFHGHGRDFDHDAERGVLRHDGRSIRVRPPDEQLPPAFLRPNRQSKAASWSEPRSCWSSPTRHHRRRSTTSRAGRHS